MTASMGSLLDSDESGFLSLLILIPSSFSSQFLAYLRMVNPGASWSSKAFGDSQLGSLYSCVVVSRTEASLKSMYLLPHFPSSVLWLITAQVLRYIHPEQGW